MPTKKKTGEESFDDSFATSKKWTLNDRVLCRYPNSEIYYEAKIIDIKEKDGHPIYSVHYQGWNSRHDEKIPQAQALERFKQYTDEDAERARDIVKRAQQERKKRKSGATGTPSDPKASKSGDTSSRASTPSVRSQQADGRRARGQSSAAQSTVGESAVVDDLLQRTVRKIILPNSLRKILTDDHNLINNQHMLPKMPARVSVEEIVQQYRNSLGDAKFRESADLEFFTEHSSDFADDYTITPCAETCEQSALGLLDYFDMTIGSLLLYKFEKPMFSDLYAKETAALEKDSNKGNKVGGDASLKVGGIIRFSKHFGLVHFLRLFTRFTETLEFTHWSTRALNAIVRHAQDFVIFLSKRYNEFYDIDKDYAVAPPEYLKRVWGGANQ